MSTEEQYEWFAKHAGRMNIQSAGIVQLQDAATYNSVLSSTGLQGRTRVASFQLDGKGWPVTLDWSALAASNIIAGTDAPGPSATLWGGINIVGSYQLQAGAIYIEWTYNGFKRRALLDLAAAGSFVIGMADRVDVWAFTCTSELVPVSGAYGFSLRPMVHGEKSNARTSMAPFSVQVGAPISAIMYLGPELSRVNLSVAGIVAGTAVLVVDFQTANLSSLMKIGFTLTSLAVGGANGSESLSIVVPNACQFVNFSTVTATANLTVGMSRVYV